MKDKIIVFSFLGYIFIFSILHIVLPDKEISNTERRKLNTFPEIKLDNEYITKLDEYLLDHFPLRDELRGVKAFFNYNILNKLDNNNIYLKDNYIFKSNYPTDRNSIEYFINNTNKLKDLLTEENKTYLMIIPDKNYYLKEDDFLQIDYDYIYKEVDKINIEKIDIKNILNLNDYYQTDTHWKQENLEKVIKEMSEVMDFEYQKQDYQKNTYNKFYGVYYGESAINRKPELLTYLTNETINNVKVTYLEEPTLTTIYNKDNLTKLDSYDVFLDGPSAFIEIENENSATEKELVIFRDSFGSSLTPLLVNYYSKITVIDNRYLNSQFLSNLIEFKNQDVLFMYSTLLVNYSYSLKG